MKSNSLLIVGGTGLEIRDSKHYSKQSYKEYFDGLKKVTKSTWITSEYEDKANFKTNIEASFYKIYSYNRTKGFVFLVRMNFRFLKEAFKNDKVLVFMPAGTYLFPAVLIMKLLGKSFVTYIGTDFTSHVISTNKLKSDLWKWVFASVVKLSNKAIVRGHYLKSLVNKTEANLLLTAPLSFRPAKNIELISSDIRFGLKTVIYIGQISKAKGIEHLIHSVVDTGDKSVKITFLGGGKDIEYISKLANDLLPGQCTFLGWVDSKEVMSTEINNSSFLVCPSIEPEGVPRVVEEAILHKLPVIATDVGGIDAEFQNNEIYKVKAEFEHIKEAIHALLNQKDVYLQYCENLLPRYKWLQENDNPSSQHYKFIFDVSG